MKRNVTANTTKDLYRLTTSGPQNTFAKAKARGQRKVLSDSEEDQKSVKVDISTPKRGTTKKQHQKETSPAGEITTTHDYFASNHKPIPTRSTARKAGNYQDCHAPSTPGRKQRASDSVTSSKRKPQTYPTDAERTGPDLGNSEIKDILADDLGEDIFMADYFSGARGQHDYESDDDEKIEVVKPQKRTKKLAEKQGQEVYMIDADAEGAAETRTLRKAQKRKSVEVDGVTGGANPPPAKAAKTIRTKSTPKKIQTNKAGTEAPKEIGRSTVQDIFDAIPTIRAPTPPSQSDPSRKFNFGAQAQRNQPPPDAGSKEIPVGAENCLAGLTFVFTGILNALGREEGQELVKRYGGKVTTSPSTKTSFVILGSDAGPKKLDTIKKYSLKTIDEDGLFTLIRNLPANGGDGKAAEKLAAKTRQEEQKIQDLAAEMDAEERKLTKVTGIGAAGIQNPNEAIEAKKTNMPAQDSQLWTVKYAPTNMSMICGNKTQVEKLQGWLRAWPRNHRVGFRMPGKDGSGVFRAMLLHGPPGIGKTTAAHLAAQLEGFDVVESNASDTRSKRLVESGLKGVLDTTSLLGYFAGDGKKVEVQRKKLVLIMDEVDGMSAGDRGGVGALAAVCKKTAIPMILICNDRKIQKMRPFDRVTYDLPFRRPTADQIRGRIMTICYREGLKIPPNVINALIEGTHADIRQIINMLSTAKLDREAMDFDAGKKMSKAWEKHLILKPWDLVGKILGSGMFTSSSTSNLNDKIELYFNDHEFSSLMLQENYLGTSPMLANAYNGNERKYKILELIDQAAESISDGDLVDRMIHGSQQQWSLMPTHAVFSFVRPASFVFGSMAGHQTRFTSWLGQNSKTGNSIP